jgi:WD40 repeat protein
MAVTGGKEMSGDPAGEPPPGRVDAFISYRRLPADMAFVDRLQEALTARGKHVWVDRAEIEPASDWAARINRGIDGAKAFIFVITPESVVSRQCLRELEIAAAQRKLIIPVVLRDVGRDQTLPDDLAKPNWIFFPAGYDTGSVLGHDAERALDEVIQALEEDLPWRDAHTRLAVRTQEWASARRDRSFLLRGSDLGAAEEWLGRAAQHQKTPPTALQTEYILASRKAAVRTQRTWRLALSAGLAVALVLAGVAFVQRNDAQAEARIAQSHAQAAEAIADLSSDPAQSVSLALSATKTNQNASAEQALRLALAQDRLRMTIRSGTGPATVAAWNPARAQIAVTAPHNSVALWDAATGRLLRILPLVHPGTVTHLLWDAAGSRLAAVSSPGYVSMWNVAATGAASPIGTGQLNALIQANGATGDLPSLGSLVNGVWLDRNGTGFYAFGTVLTNVFALDVGSGTAGPLFRGSFKFGGPDSVVPSPDGSKLLVGGEGGEIITLATGQQTVLSPPPPGVPGPYCWFPDGSAVVTSTAVDAGGPQQFYQASTGAQFASMRTPAGPTSAVACSASSADQWAASGDESGNVVLRLAGGTVLPLSGHSDIITAIASSPDGRYLATSSNDGTARIWDASNGRVITVLNDGAKLMDIQFGTTAGLALTVDNGGLVRIWDTGVGLPATGLQSPAQGQTVALHFTSGGRQVSGVNFVTSAGPTATITSASALTWNAQNGRLDRRVGLPGIAASAVPCSAGLQDPGRDAALAIISGGLCGIPPPSDLVLAIPVPRPVAVSSYGAVIELMAVAASLDGRYVAYARAGSVALLSATGHQVAALPVSGTPTGLSFGTSDDDLLVLTGRDIYLWQPLSGHRPLVIPQPSAPIDAAVSQSGTVLAAAGADGTVEVWSAVDGRPIRSLRTVKTPSQSYFSPTPLRVAISAAGDVVASGNADGTVFLWNVSTGKRIAIQRVSTWPIIELSAAGAPRLLAVDWPQAGSGVNPAGSASVLNSATGQVVAAYRSPAPVEAPVDPAAALSPDGNFLFTGALGLAPSAPGGIEAAYQVSGSQLMADLQTAAEPPTTSYSELPAQPWSPDGARLLAGNSIYPCDACGALAELQAAAASRIAWARPLSTASDHPPTSNPYG